MLIYDSKKISDVNFFDEEGNYIQITSIYSNRRRVWKAKDVGPTQGYLFSRDGYALLSRDGYTLKARNQ